MSKMTMEEFRAHREFAESVLVKFEERFRADNSTITINGKGHSLSDRDLVYFRPWNFSFFSREELLKIEAGEEVEPQLFDIGSGICAYCGEHYRTYFNGVSLYAATECKYPGGIVSHTFELNVPSGKMVFANDLRQWFNCHVDYDVNADVGKVLTTEAYAKIGMAHAFVGNSCPTVYQVDDSHLTISGSTYCEGEEAFDSEVDDWVELTQDQAEALSPPGKEVGSICTDLWWYSVVDYEDFRRRYLDQNGSEASFKKLLKNSCDVVSVTPGVYLFTHHEERRIDVKGMKPFHYAEIAWLREVDESDKYAEYKKLNYTIGQCFLADYIDRSKHHEDRKNLSIDELVARLNSYSAEDLEHSTARFYSDIFCSFDRGSWHPNGWGLSRPISENIPDFQLPPLTKKHYWSDMSEEYCGLLLASTGKESYLGYNIPTLNESFLNAAYEMCYSILKFGADGFDRKDEKLNREEEKAKQRLTLKALKNLIKRFPGTLPDKCKEFV